LDDDSVKCWGQNAVGQLGLGDNTDRGKTAPTMGDALPPVNLGLLRKAKAIAAGEAHTCAILDNDALKCWGSGTQGQLGLGDGAYHGNDPGEMGEALFPVNLGTGRHAVAIGAGQHHTCAVLDDKTMKCWGEGGVGQLGQGSTATLGNGLGEMGDALPAIDLGGGRTVLRLAVGWTHTCAVTDDQQLRCFGANAEGQLGPTTSSPWGNGPGEMGANLPAVMLGAGRTVVRAAAGDDHTCALLNDQKVKCWGNNADGQLGQGDTQDRGKNASEMGEALTPVSLF
jgi:alpha-tubulin suppressor-like RCC1 family protein